MSLTLDNAIGENRIKSICFNNERDTIICLTENGYQLINCCPVVTLISKNLCQHGYKSVSIYKRSNIMAFTGSDKTVKYKSNTVYIYDDSNDTEIDHIVFPTAVVCCKIQYEFLIVILETETIIFRLSDLTLYRKFKTAKNTRGICEIQYRDCLPVITTMGETKGSIRITYGKKEFLIHAHETGIANLCISYDGILVASSSVRGSVIRVFDATSGKCLSAIRRGHIHADIVNMEFDRHSQYLICNSETTVHIAKRNGMKVITRLSDVSLSDLNITDSSNSLADFGQHVFSGLFGDSFSFRYSKPDHSKSMIAVFGAEPESVYIITSKGKFVKLSVDAERGFVEYQNTSLVKI